MRPGEIIVDSFAGGGGASLGISWALGRSPDIAINHDREAIALHAANHPDSLHLAEDVWKVDPVEACAGRPVGLMWLSPDCKHFSKAKGGKPVSKKIRGLAWVAIRWAAAVRPRVIVLENVEEFQTWGPVLRDTGRPCPVRKGETFRAFLRKLKRFGYVVEWRELRACDYGAPTIRKRLFLIARCDGEAIVWPAPTHGKGRALPWRTAAECIDWSIPCPSIFLSSEEAKKLGVRRPLAPATMRRIARGIKKFVLDNPRPFIVPMQHQNRPTSIDEPIQTITTQGNKFNVVAPYLATYYGAKREGDDRIADLSEGLRTQGTENRFALVAPFLKPRYGEDPDPSRRGGLGQAPRVRSLEEPMPVIVPTGNGGDLVAAFLAKHYGGHETPGAQLDLPISTVTTQDHH
ncbi:MAG TPA: DNA cytosine methyltransferase, partial [Gemmatimonadaceae bacterium]|nr:DNA cytosine methyltransferase [Gemmatimonadaceae bacterium]